VTVILPHLVLVGILIHIGVGIIRFGDGITLIGVGGIVGTFIHIE
jgi:hypothetical protein